MSFMNPTPDGPLSYEQAAQAANGTLIGPAEGALPSAFFVDSREVTEHSAFVALTGCRVDGHAFLERAVEAGAVFCLVNASHREQAETLSKRFGRVAFLCVDDTERALVQLAKTYLDALGARIVGVTGSAGKTTTRELIAQGIASLGGVHSAVKSHNTLIGSCLTVLSAPPGTRILVMEYGANRPREIAENVAHFPPTWGGLTSVLPAHLEGFSSLRGVLAAKLELLGSPRLDWFAYNADIPILSENIAPYAAKTKNVSVGERGADIRIVASRLEMNGETPLLSVTIEECPGCAETFSVRLFGFQHATNVALAYAVAKELGVAAGAFAKNIETISPLAGRGRFFRTRSGAWIVDEAYNANPASMRCSLINVLNFSPQGRPPARRIAVLGGMRELGERTRFFHEELRPLIQEFEEVYFVGEEWGEGVSWARSAAELLPELLRTIGEGDLVLVKGSQYYALDVHVVEKLKEDAHVD